MEVTQRSRGSAHIKQGAPAPANMPGSDGSAAAGGPPAPPPPADFSSTAPTSAATGPSALLADLNRGGSVTSGLRKVDPSQQTHKNPDLRASGVVPDAKKTAPAVKPKPGTAAPPVKKLAKVELEGGNKWIIVSQSHLHAEKQLTGQENQDGNKDIVIEQTELSHTVHIFSCINSVIRISGKINAVTMGTLSLSLLSQGER
jgi:adenylyl cyclase-associated protein